MEVGLEMPLDGFDLSRDIRRMRVDVATIAARDKSIENWAVSEAIERILTYVTQTANILEGFPNGYEVTKRKDGE